MTSEPFRQAELRHPSFCPVCFALLNGSAPIAGNDKPPRQGDLTVCIYCKTISCFEADLSLRMLSTEELAALRAFDADGIELASGVAEQIRQMMPEPPPRRSQ